MSYSRASQRLLSGAAFIFGCLGPLQPTHAAPPVPTVAPAPQSAVPTTAQPGGPATYLDAIVERARTLLVSKQRDPKTAASLLAEASAAGHTGAMLTLAGLYVKGDGVAADFDRAKALIENAIAASGSDDGWAALGDLYRDADADHHDVAKAIDAYQKASDLGNRWAMISLARLVTSGEGAPADFDRAKKLLQSAIAGGGDPATLAWTILGDLYRNAPVPVGDPAQAIAAYRQAVGFGDTTAMISLGQMYAAGVGGAGDFDRAKALFDTAIEAGSAKDGWANLGDLYRDADTAHRDTAAAAQAYQKASDLGDTWSTISLGRLYATGDGVAPDFARAKKLYETATAGGADTARSAWIGLAELYRKTPPPRRDMAKAVISYQRAIELGDTGAMISLGEMYARSDGLTADFEKAMALFEKAVGAGAEKDGSASLGDLYRNADDAHRDLAKAAAAYRKAADLGDAGSMLTLGKMLSSGTGVPADAGAAEGLFQKAIAAGSARDGWAALGVLYRGTDPVREKDAYEKASELGDPWSMISLSQVLVSGDSATADPVRAQDLLNKAIDGGGDAATWAWVRLGDLYRSSGTLHDGSKAMEAYQKAFGLKNTDAMVSLARMLATGDGVKVDFKQAKGLLETAIAAGAQKEGWAALGDLYRDADATKRDAAKAIAAYQKAADLGDAWSMISLGGLLATGDGAPADAKRAAALFESATATGGDVARVAWMNLGELYKADPAKAAIAYGKAADLGDAAAMLRLGSMYVSGEGVTADNAAARALFDKAIAAGAAKDGWAALGTLYRASDPAKAADAYQKAADLGDGWSMVGLGRMLASGDGVPANLQRAESLYEAAVPLGGGSAQAAWLGLGDLYHDDRNSLHDLAKAAAAYQKAIALGSKDAMVDLGRMYAAGEGVSPDFDKAKALFESAIAGGAGKDGWAAIANLYRNAADGDRDLYKAVEAYQKAVDLGDARSMLALADMVGSGSGIDADFDRAKDLYEKAIAAGYEKDGWASLGSLYRNADEAHRDAAKAVVAYQKAADLGDAYSMVSLGRMLSSGSEIAADYPRAKALFGKATSLPGGSAPWAWVYLGDLARNTKGPYLDPAQAAASYEKAVGLGNVQAMILLGRMYSEGTEIPFDFEKAIALLDRAAAGGSADAALAEGDLYASQGAHRDAAKALKAYQVAAAYGRPEAHLAAAKLMSSDPDQYPSKEPIAQHFQQAAKSLGAAEVAKTMFTLKPEALYGVVQELLIDAGKDPGPADGIYRRKTKQAIDQFCASRKIASCAGSYVTLALLNGLLTER
jgi:TPR repeat protein